MHNVEECTFWFQGKEIKPITLEELNAPSPVTEVAAEEHQDIKATKGVIEFDSDVIDPMVWATYVRLLKDAPEAIESDVPDPEPLF